MNAVKTFTFIHPVTGLKCNVAAGECARLLHTLAALNGKWIEALSLTKKMESNAVTARMSNIKDKHGPEVIEQRDGRKTAKGKRLKEYRLNPNVIVTEA